MSKPVSLYAPRPLIEINRTHQTLAITALILGIIFLIGAISLRVAHIHGKVNLYGACYITALSTGSLFISAFFLYFGRQSYILGKSLNLFRETMGKVEKWCEQFKEEIAKENRERVHDPRPNDKLMQLITLRIKFAEEFNKQLSYASKYAPGHWSYSEYADHGRFRFGGFSSGSSSCGQINGYGLYCMQVAYVRSCLILEEVREIWHRNKELQGHSVQHFLMREGVYKDWRECSECYHLIRGALTQKKHPEQGYFYGVDALDEESRSKVAWHVKSFYEKEDPHSELKQKCRELYNDFCDRVRALVTDPEFYSSDEIRQLTQRDESPESFELFRKY